ncbi:MAG: hypothetical protein M0C28_29870 [Candidatus Moduliflexus flocculans]|nr:hypothetical protein [Candidatus Moduliflexus flocculans]
MIAFRRGLGKAVERQLGGIIREEPTLQIDAWLGLDEISLDLADAIEMLAPFGAGNPKLTLATRGVTMKSVSEIGKGKEHLRLTVEDEDGNSPEHPVVGRRGRGTAGKRGKVRHCLFAARLVISRRETGIFAVRGIRVGEEKPADVQKPKLEVRDMRLQPSLLNLQPSTLIWAEGADRAAGVPRFELHQSDEFSIYTMPPPPPTCAGRWKL